MLRAHARLGLALALACAPASPPRPAGDADALAVARLEAQRDAGTPALLERTRGPATPGTLLAIRALGRTGDPPAIAALVALLGAPEPPRRDAAAEALGTAALLGANVGDAEAALLAAWTAALADPADDARPLAAALGRLGSAAAVPVLTRALAADRPAALREAAATALGVLGRRKLALDAPARAALLKLAATPSDDPPLADPPQTDPRQPRAEPPDLARAAAYALANEHAPDDRAAADRALIRLARAVDPRTRALAVAGLARRRADARSTFSLALTDADWQVRVAAVRGLAGDAREPALAALWTWLAGELARSDMLQRPGAIHPVLEALSLLTAQPDPAAPSPSAAAAAQALVERRLAAASPVDRLVLARIACALAALAARDPAWRLPLRCADAAGPAADLDRLSFEAALLARGRGGDIDARLARLTALAGDPDPAARAAALTAAADLWTDRPLAVEALLGHALGDSAPAVAGAAAAAVQARFAAGSPAPGPALWRPLVARAAVERDSELFTELAGALAAIADPTGLPACRAALTDASPVVRKAAAACTAALGGDPGAAAHAPAAAPPFDPAPVLAGAPRWRLVTTRGAVDIALDPGAAPWHVAALVALTRRGFYDGLRFHRVVPGFVVQGGDPHGTGWGGPGFQLPAEPDGGRFDRGAVGVADAGKDTGGSQFFVMHARAPHLEGRYTRVGRVVAGLDVVDALVVGDTILTATILDAP